MKRKRFIKLVMGAYFSKKQATAFADEALSEGHGYDIYINNSDFRIKLLCELVGARGRKVFNDLGKAISLIVKEISQRVE